MTWIIAPLILVATAQNHTLDAKGFVTQIIVDEENGKLNVGENAFLDLLTPTLKSAFQRDMKNGEVGVLDYDPICQCQDTDGLKMRILSSSQKGSSARVKVENKFPTTATFVTFSLQRINGIWKLSDVSTAEVPSLAKLLQGN